jgi:hypothetical protein
METIKFFVASCDAEKLNKCILKNQHLSKYDIEIQFDRNRKRGLPERYNDFIDRNLDSDSWLVFIHDDVELLEDIGPRLEGLPRNVIYGACGAKKINGKGEIIGRIQTEDPRVNGGRRFSFGREVAHFEIVPTFDPFFICMHSTLFKKRADIIPGLTFTLAYVRFDENLGYHLFSEELNINAKKNYGIESAVLQISCCHYSFGTKAEEYYQALEYIYKKHGISKFIGTCEKQAMDNDPEWGWK